VALGPHHPTWKALYDALAALATECGGPFSFVLDEGNGLWCVGLRGEEATTLTFDQNEAADRFYRAEIVPRMMSMQRGHKFEIVRSFIDVNVGSDRYYAMSFASIYALVVWFESAFDVAKTRDAVKRSLPRIEALVLDLPPSGGPDAGEGRAAKQRA
jgi:hypothetical protein